jgi:hypothetical protein
MEVFKSQAFLEKFINIWAIGFAIGVAANGSVADVVWHHDDDVGATPSQGCLREQLELKNNTHGEQRPAVFDVDHMKVSLRHKVGLGSIPRPSENPDIQNS